MITQIIDNSLETLASNWNELAEAFRRYARTFAVANPDRVLLDNPNGPLATTPIHGFAQACDFTPPSNLPSGTQIKIRGEVQRIIAASNAVTSASNLKDRFVRATSIFEQSNNRSTPTSTPDEVNYFKGLTELQASYLLFTGSHPDTFEQRDCFDRIKQIADFIDRTIRESQELQDDKEITKQFDIRGIRGSVDNLSAYPILTSEISTRSTPFSAGRSNENYSVRKTVNLAVREVLGRIPKTGDTRSFVASLNRTFRVSEIEGRTDVVWVPSSFAGETELGGGITGGQASLYSRAKFSLDQALPLLGGLYALKPDADVELVESSRSIVRAYLIELIGELGTEGGPRAARIDGLFEDLFDAPLPAKAGDPPVKGQLQRLAAELGMSPDRVNTLEEETNFSNFIALRDYIQSIRAGWTDFSESPDGKDLGTRLVRLSRSLSVASDSVVEVTDAMDSVFVGEAERQVATFRDKNGRRVQIDDVLSWVSDFTAKEAPNVIHEGGRRGVESITPTASRLAELVERLIQSLDYEPDIPDGVRQARVRNPLRELASHLRRIERSAKDVQLT